MYSPLLGRFLSADSIVPRPGDPQSLNRYSYTRNNPISRIDPDGHADKDPGKDILCKYSPAACMPDPQLTPKGGGEVLNVNDGSVEAVPGPDGQVMAKGSGKGVVQKVKDAAVGAALKVCSGILAIVCGNWARKVAEQAADAMNRDGDPTNEVQEAIVITDKIARQMTRRGWTTDLIETTRSAAYTAREAVNKANGNPATAYYNKDGSYVVVDNVTKEVIQVSNRLDPKWIADSTIKNPYVPKK
jgi:hypothetical protein